MDPMVLNPVNSLRNLNSSGKAANSQSVRRIPKPAWLGVLPFLEQPAL